MILCGSAQTSQRSYHYRPRINRTRVHNDILNDVYPQLVFSRFQAQEGKRKKQKQSDRKQRREGETGTNQNY